MTLGTYECKTTFWNDFTIAEMFGGVKGIRETYKRALKEWKSDYVYLTELVMVLNWKIWHFYERNDTYARVYNELWESASYYASTHLKGDELSYYYSTTD